MNRQRFLVAMLGGSLLLGLSGPAFAAPRHGSKILFITSNQHTYGDTKLNTANHLAEIVAAYDNVKKHGYVVDFVSPSGGAIPLGYIETSNKIQKDLLYNDLFEDTKAPYYKTFQFPIGNEINKHGGKFVHSQKYGESFHVVDGNIITGQDPSSSAVVAEQVIKAIRARIPQ